jgi:hypothetical protein
MPASDSNLLTSLCDMCHLHKRELPGGWVPAQ